MDAVLDYVFSKFGYSDLHLGLMTTISALCLCEEEWASTSVVVPRLLEMLARSVYIICFVKRAGEVLFAHP